MQRVQFLTTKLGVQHTVPRVMAVGVIACALMVGVPLPLSAADGGRAIVKVETQPDFGGGTFTFDGEPGGELTLVAGEPRSLVAAGLAVGDRTSTLVEIDPAVTAAGYDLTAIVCSDPNSATPSSGNLDNRTATFRIDDGETVTCVFKLSAGGCLCPKEGRWTATNNPGTMACTGTMTMTMPLTAATSTGSMEVRDNCNLIVASGMSEDEATIEMHLQDDCTYKGSVGGSQHGIPMVIDFTWQVVDSETITGDLYSTHSEQGTTCEMKRTYELNFTGP